MEVSFDIRGNLKPYEKIELTLQEFKEIFVDSFEEDSSRHLLYEEYLKYVNDLKHTLSIPFRQWVNGSFVSNRKKPKDVDFVTFINQEVYEHLETQIDSRFSKWSVGNFYQKLDAYTIWEYPENHRFYKTFQSDNVILAGLV